jgi:uncharacterized membrane protein YeaQ/YmgE (transglycosylase-associated protein family)
VAYALIGIAAPSSAVSSVPFFWKSADGRFHPAGLIMSIIGALILLWAYMKFFAR